MSRARVLIVEDEVLVAVDLEAALEEMGFNSVGIAPDTQAALELAARRPDIALVDIHLRDGQTGPAIASRLAADFGVLVVLVTANPRMAYEVRTAGVVGVLGKPCHEDVVASALDYALRMKTGAPLPAPPPGLTLLPAA